MKLGIFLNSQHPVGDDPARRLAETLEQARLIKRLGFDSIWAGEHHVTEGSHYFPLLPMLHRIAGEAEGLELGTNIVLLPLHNPIEIAEVSAFLDVMTGGKFTLGVGLGYRPEEFQAFGVNIKQRVSRMEEGVEIIRRLWTEDRVTHRGRHWQFDAMTIRPQPLNKPRPPIIIAAQVPASIERAARIGDGWTLVPLPRREQAMEEIALYKSSRAKAGLPPSQHIVRLFEVSCAADEATALRRAAPYLLGKYADYAKWGLPGVTLDPNAAPEERLRNLARDRFAIGDPRQVVAVLMEQHALGIHHLTMRISWPGMPQADILASIEAIGRNVLPEVRRRVASEGRGA